VYFSDGNQPRKPSSPTLLSNMASIAASLLDLARRPSETIPVPVPPTMVVPQPTMVVTPGVTHFGRFVATSVPPASMQPQAMQLMPMHLYVQPATHGEGNPHASAQQPTPGEDLPVALQVLCDKLNPAIR